MLFEKIIRSYETKTGRGIPIGNLTSQYFANLYLGTLDHYVKEELQIKGYLRYMDDFVLLADPKEELKECHAKVEKFLRERLRLELNAPQLNQCKCGIPYLGYRIMRNRFRLSQHSKLRFKKKYQCAEKKLFNGSWSQKEYSAHILPLLAFVQRADSKGFLRKILGMSSMDDVRIA